MAAFVFVAAGVKLGRRVWCFPKAGIAIPRELLSGMPMSATTTSPQSMRPGRRRWAGFLRKKVTVRSALTHAPRGLAGQAIKAGGNINGDDGNACGVYPVGQVLGKIAVEASAIERIDDEFRTGDVIGDGDGPAPFLQIARGDLSILAIVAGAAEDDGFPAP